MILKIPPKLGKSGCFIIVPKVGIIHHNPQTLIPSSTCGNISRKTIRDRNISSKDHLKAVLQDKYNKIPQKGKIISCDKVKRITNKILNKIFQKLLIYLFTLFWCEKYGTRLPFIFRDQRTKTNINHRKSLYCFSKYSPLGSMPFCMRLNQLQKHFCHSD